MQDTSSSLFFIVRNWREFLKDILFTHSQGGGSGWYTAMKNNNVKAIVAFEPGNCFVFPEKELPAPMLSAFDTLKGESVPMEQFMALTKIPF